MIPLFPELRPIEIDDLEMMRERLLELEPLQCEMNVANIFSWREFDRPQLTRFDDDVGILFSAETGHQFFLEPIGRTNPQKTIQAMLDRKYCVSRLSESYLSLLPPTTPREPLRSQFDYVYRVTTMTELKGKSFDGKRNHIRKFLSEHPAATARPLTPSDRDAILTVFDRWAAPLAGERREGASATSTDIIAADAAEVTVAAQRSALKNALLLFEPLKLEGLGVFIDNALSAFILGSRLNSTTVSAHFEYYIREPKGISQFLVREACATVFSHYELINMEQDLGLEGLRKTKLSYHPEFMVQKFKIPSAQC